MRLVGRLQAVMFPTAHEHITANITSLMFNYMPPEYRIRSMLLAAKELVYYNSKQHGVMFATVPRTFASLMSVRGMRADFALVPRRSVRSANGAELREARTQCSQARPPNDEALRSCSHCVLPARISCNCPSQFHKRRNI